MTLDDIRFALYRYILSPTQRGKELTAACRAVGHGRIEIVIKDSKIVQINVLGTQIEDKDMERRIAELSTNAGKAPIANAN